MSETDMELFNTGVFGAEIPVSNAVKRDAARIPLLERRLRGEMSAFLRILPASLLVWNG